MEVKSKCQPVVLAGVGNETHTYCAMGLAFDTALCLSLIYSVKDVFKVLNIVWLALSSLQQACPIVNKQYLLTEANFCASLCVGVKKEQIEGALLWPSLLTDTLRRWRVHH